jgi:hypothetical protein
VRLPELQPGTPEAPEPGSVRDRKLASGIVTVTAAVGARIDLVVACEAWARLPTAGSVRQQRQRQREPTGLVAREPPTIAERSSPWGR